MVDIFKLSGKQAALMSKSSLLKFLSICRKYKVMAVGNPIMDVALTGGKKTVDGYLSSLADYGIEIVEISAIARSLDDDDTCRLIEIASKKGIKVINEIGFAFAHSKVTEEMNFH